MSLNGLTENKTGLKIALQNLKRVVRSIDAQLDILHKLQKKLGNQWTRKSALTSQIYQEDAKTRWNLCVSGEIKPTLSDVLRWLGSDEIVGDEKFINVFSEYLKNIKIESLRRIFKRYLDFFTLLSTRQQIKDRLAEAVRSRISEPENKIKLLFNSNAPVLLAKDFKEHRGLIFPKPNDVKLTLGGRDIRLRSEGQFFIEFVNHYVSIFCMDIKKLTLENVNLLLKILGDLIHQFGTGNLKLAISNLIRICDTLGDPEKLIRVAEFIIKHNKLGDPFLHERNWLHFNDEERSLVKKLVKKFHLNYFFDVLFENRKDPHNRKKFWDRYVGMADQVKVFVSQRDLRLHPDLLDIVRDRGYFIVSANDSCFAMYFKGYVVVEFAEINNAAYIYLLRNFEKLLSKQQKGNREYGDIKDRLLAMERINHTEGWEEHAKRTFRRLGLIAK